MRNLLRFTTFCLALTALLAFAASAPAAAARFDASPRVAVISAFEPELKTLLANVSAKKRYRANGVEFVTGTLRGKRVVLFLSGISMVNAAMNTQLALERFNITHIVFSGIAGGVNPALNIGDVVVAERWTQYLETLAAREVSPGNFEPPGWMKDATTAPFGMWHPRPVGVLTKRGQKEDKRWFEVDAALLQIARAMKEVPLADCDAKQVCLASKPRILVGGAGVSGQVFVDNAALREYTFRTFQANVLDMETAAVAHVAYANSVPYIAFRSLSDLAGGGKGENEIETFFKIASDNSAKVLMAFFDAWK